MPLIIQSDWYTTKQLRDNPDTIFVFGDNHQRQGTGGQAKICRFEPNTIGIVTKWDRFRNHGSYMYDQTYEYNVKVINDDMWVMQRALMLRKTVIWPSDGVGTGLALLSTNAPKTLDFINFRLQQMITLYVEQ